MKLTDLFLADLEHEAAVNRKVLERVPEGRPDWKPHTKSMALGYLANLVATMPSWIAMMIDRDEFDLRPVNGPKYTPPETPTTKALLEAAEASVAQARQALQNTTDEHLMKPWKFMVGGNVVDDRARYIQIREAVFSHLAHHRGQLSVYLRLNEALVPAMYGPSADEGIAVLTASR